MTVWQTRRPARSRRVTRSTSATTIASRASGDLLRRELVAEADGGHVLVLVAPRQRFADRRVIEVDRRQAQQPAQRDHVAEQLLPEMLRAE